MVYFYKLSDSQTKLSFALPERIVTFVWGIFGMPFATHEGIGLKEP